MQRVFLTNPFLQPTLYKPSLSSPYHLSPHAKTATSSKERKEAEAEAAHMGIKNLRFMVLVIFVVLVGILIGSENVALGQACNDSLPGLITQCGNYVQKSGPRMKPSKACCSVIQSVDIPCICDYVNPGIEGIIDMGKVIYVARHCGVVVKQGMQCGSYIVP